MYSQHSNPWGSQHLGFSQTDTISAYGCYISCMAEIVAGYVSPGFTPLDMNTVLKSHKLFVQGDLVANDNVLHQIWPNSFGPSQVFNYRNALADLTKLATDPNEFVIIEIDFDHNPADGIQTHFLIVKSWDGRNLLVGDPWYGTVDNFVKHYGSNLHQTILKIIRYPHLVPAPAVPLQIPPVYQEVPITPIGVTVTFSPRLGVHAKPSDNWMPDNLAIGTPDGFLRPGNTFIAVGTAESEGALWLHTSKGNWVKAQGTNYASLLPQDVPIQVTPPVETGPVGPPSDATPEQTPVEHTEAVAVNQATNAVADFTSKWVKTLQDVPIMNTVSNTPAYEGEKKVVVPAGVLFKVIRLKRSNGSVYYQTANMVSKDPDWGIRSIDVQDAEDPEVTALSAIANLTVLQRVIPASVHAIHGQGFMKWLFPKKEKRNV